jgi:ABC-2 type transport system ATP-binding protein
MISVRNLRVDYDTTCAVNDLSFDIRPGETYGLIGPNGAGKTSTLRALAGLLQPTYGQILIDGVDMLIDREKAQQKMGFMPDFPPLYDDLLVWEFLDLFAASYSIPKAERPAAIEANLGQVELTGKRASMCKELSRGMRQRLMLAKTLLPSPAFLLLDEPASGLDPHGRTSLKDILKRFTAQGGAVLISSHVLAEMNDYCTAVGIMQRGKMVVSGSLEEVAQRVGRPDVLLVEVVSGEDILAQLVADRGNGPAVHKGGANWEVPFDGDRDTAADLLAEAVARGVRIASFAPRRDTLEDLFMQVGAKEVS